jgi:leucyl/phenylalanyl-tRNA--protein transferase
MVQAYTKLHKLGYAHSIEAWQDNKLVGGLYGISIGGSFFGESMFSFVNDASKIALVALVKLLKKSRFDLIDCQVTTQHLLDMGAVEIPRSIFLNILKKSVQRKMDNFF